MLLKPAKYVACFPAKNVTEANIGWPFFMTQAQS